MTALVRRQTEPEGVHPCAINGAHWSAGAPALQLIVLRYSQQSRVTGTPSITLVEGPSTQIAAESSVQRPPLDMPEHWSSHRSVAVVVASLGIVPAPALSVIKIVQTLLLSAAMFALGTGVNVRKLLGMGGRPILLGASATVIITLLGLGGVLLTTT